VKNLFIVEWRVPSTSKWKKKKLKRDALRLLLVWKYGTATNTPITAYTAGLLNKIATPFVEIGSERRREFLYLSRINGWMMMINHSLSLYISTARTRSFQECISRDLIQ